MKPLAYTLAIMSFCIGSCRPEKEVREAHAQIQQLLADYYTTLSDRDWVAYRSFFTGQATLATVWQENPDSVPRIFAVSISEFIAQTPQGPDSQPVFEERMVDSEINVRNSLAQAWVKYEAKFGTTDKLMEWKGYDLFSLIRFEDEWKIVSIVYEAE